MATRYTNRRNQTHVYCLLRIQHLAADSSHYTSCQFTGRLDPVVGRRLCQRKTKDGVIFCVTRSHNQQHAAPVT